VRQMSVWEMLLGVERAVVEEVIVEQEGDRGVGAPDGTPASSLRGCAGGAVPREDRGEGRRRWRALDLGATLAYLEADAPRVRCARHGRVVAEVPWARHGSRFTAAFGIRCAGWLSTPQRRPSRS